MFLGGFLGNSNQRLIDEQYDPNGRFGGDSFLGDIVEWVDNGLSSLGQGLKNAWYNLTGQTEKTSAYQAQVERENELIQRQEEREDTAYQRASEDLIKAGLSKYGGISGASSSAGGSTGVSGESKGLVYMNQLIDLASKQAGIEQVKANTAHTKAETDSIITRNGFLPDLLNVQLSESNARVELIKNQSAQVADSIISSVQGRSIAMAEHIVNMQIKQKDIGLIESQIQNYASEIAKRQAEIYHLSKEDEYLVADLAYKELSTEVMKYNYDYSVKHGIRTTDSATKVGGINIDQAFDIVAKKIGFNWHDGFYFKDPSRIGGGGRAW